jgi:hypothetical protein
LVARGAYKYHIFHWDLGTQGFAEVARVPKVSMTHMPKKIHCVAPISAFAPTKYLLCAPTHFALCVKTLRNHMQERSTKIFNNHCNYFYNNLTRYGQGSGWVGKFVMISTLSERYGCMHVEWLGIF